MDIVDFADLSKFSEYVCDGLWYMQPDSEGNSLQVNGGIIERIEAVPGRRRDSHRTYLACLNTLNMRSEIFPDGVIASYNDTTAFEWTPGDEKRFIEETDPLISALNERIGWLWAGRKYPHSYVSVRRGKMLKMWIFRGTNQERVIELIEEPDLKTIVSPIPEIRHVRQIREDKKGQFELF